MEYPSATDPDDPVGGAHALYLDYAEAVDEFRPEDFADLWAESGRLFLDPRAPEGVSGADIAQWLVRGLRHGSFVGTLHHISGIRVANHRGGSFDMTAYVIAVHKRLGGDVVNVFGRYRSRAVFERDRWRFSEHRIELVGDDPDRSGAVAREWTTMRASPFRGIYQSGRAEAGGP